MDPTSTPDLQAPSVVRLCGLHELGDGTSRGFDPCGTGRDTMFVVRSGTGLHGWVNSCPHVDGAPMAWRKDAYLNASRDRVVCYAHGALFEIDTGVCTRGPCLGQQLTPVALHVDAQGDVYAEVTPLMALQGP
jgi:nitrite reductase/ring-hydroxylating ferredoxin subunit